MNLNQLREKKNLNEMYNFIYKIEMIKARHEHELINLLLMILIIACLLISMCHAVKITNRRYENQIDMQREREREKKE